MGGEVIFHRLDHGAEKFIGNIRYNKAHCLFLAGAEAPGGGIRRVAQFRDGLIDFFLRLTGNIPGVINSMGDRGGGDAGQARHVADRHFHRFPPLRKRIPVCVIN